MFFITKVLLQIKAGKGGDGKVSFSGSISKKGVPDGGNGGNGGNIYFRSSNNLESLKFLLSRKKVKAENGFPGEENLRSGRRGKDVFIDVPFNTYIYLKEESGEKKLIFKIDSNEKDFLVAKGGRGGRGNKTYVSSTNRSPREFTRGEEGDFLKVSLEIKPESDILIFGFENSGKTSFFNSITNQKRKINDYGFSHSEPNFGLINEDNKRFSIIDLPSVFSSSKNQLNSFLNLENFFPNSKILLFFLNYDEKNVIQNLLRIKDNLAYINVFNRNLFLIINNITSDNLIEIKNNISLFNKKEKMFKDIIIIKFSKNLDTADIFKNLKEKLLLFSKKKENKTRKEEKEEIFKIYDFTK